jgi:hypothetical protein
VRGPDPRGGRAQDGIFGALRGKLDVVDLWEFYDLVETLITDLRSAGYVTESDQVEVAIRGGATSGEILGRLSGVLPVVGRQVPKFRTEADDLAAWAKDASGLK